MSFLISGIDSFILGKPPLRTRAGEVWKGVTNFSLLGKEEVQKSLERTAGCLNDESIEIECSDDNVTINFLFLKVYRNMSFVLRAVINRHSRQLHLTYKLLNAQQSYMVVNSGQRRIFTAKILAFFHRCLPNLFNQYKFSIHTTLGAISIEHPTFFQLSPNLDNLAAILSFYIKTFFKSIKSFYDTLLNIIQISNENLCPYQKDLLFIGGGNRIKKIQKYSKITSIVLNLGTDQINEQSSLKEKMLQEQQSIDNLNKNSISVDQEFKSRSLFSFVNEKIVNPGALSELEFNLDEKDRKQIKTKLQIPQIKAMLEDSERNFVVNHVKLAKKINDQRLNKIATGGFANIYLTEIEYYPISSHAIARTQLNLRCENRDIKKKTVILKRQTVNPLRETRNRLQHQKDILIKIKSALSIFIPRYYFIYNPTEEETHDLLIQHIYLHNNTFSLEDYVKKFKLSLSQQSIIYFAFMISQGLRYLKGYDIVHLDIKLGNIMIGKKLAVKIIDFGESFHPSFKNHRPGVSMPYSPPECYKNGDQFSSKSDVYSFGVLLYYLLTSRYPFYLNQKKQREQVYRQENIADRWFYTPQGLGDYGQTSVFPFLQLLMGKCMHPDPRCRPELQWISLILRQYLEYFR